MHAKGQGRARGRSAYIFLTISAVLVVTGGVFSDARKPDHKDFVPPRCRGSVDMRCGTGLTPLSPEQLLKLRQSPENFIRHRGLPTRVDLSPGMPIAGDQGRQGSCAAFATIYHVAAYEIAKREGWKFDPRGQSGPGRHILTPAYSYNQTNRGQGEGSNFYSNFNIMKEQGIPPWRFMPYVDRDNATQPDARAYREARNYRAKDAEHVNGGNVSALKALLAKGHPLVTSICVHDNFSRDAYAGVVQDRNEGQCRGGHAIVFVGYDDSKVSPRGHKGAFKILNSWGPGWGKDGYAWLSYQYAIENKMSGSAIIVEPRQDRPEPKPEPAPEAVTPRPPSRVEASRGVAEDRIDVSWSAVDGAVSYAVERSGPGESDAWAQLGYAKEGSYSDTSVQPGATYRYRIRSIGPQASSDPAESPVAEGYAKEKPRPQVPGRVIDLRADYDGTGSSLRLAWEEVPGAERYEVWHRTDSTSIKLVGTSREVEYVHAGVEVGANYYHVRAVNTAGPGDYSEYATAERPKTTSPPGAVRDLTATKGAYGDRVEIKWRATPGANGYEVYRFNFATERYELDGVRLSSNSYSDKVPKSSEIVQYGYYVRAYNSKGWGDWSEFVRGYADPARGRGASALAPPTGLRASADSRSSSATLVWGPVKGAQEYYVFSRTDKSKNFAYLGKSTGARFSTKIEPGLLYFFQVRAKSPFGGESASSNTDTAFINQAVPLVRKRAPADAGFSALGGRWSGYFWNGGPRRTAVRVELSLSGSTALVRILADDARVYEGRGDFASGATKIETGAVTVRLVPDAKGVAYLETRDARILGAPGELALSR